MLRCYRCSNCSWYRAIISAGVAVPVVPSLRSVTPAAKLPSIAASAIVAPAHIPHTRDAVVASPAPQTSMGPDLFGGGYNQRAVARRNPHLLPRVMNAGRPVRFRAHFLNRLRDREIHDPAPFCASFWLHLMMTLRNFAIIHSRESANKIAIPIAAPRSPPCPSRTRPCGHHAGIGFRQLIQNDQSHPPAWRERFGGL